MKKHFEEYNELDHRITELQYKLTSLENDLYGLKGVSYDFMPKGSTALDHKALLIEEKDAVIKEMNELKKEKQKLYDKHIKEISLVKDERYRSVLRCWYLLKMDYGTIAEMLNVSIKYLYKLKNSAVDEFIFINNINATK